MAKKTTSIKAAKSAARALHPTVVSYRITDTQAKRLTEVFKADAAVGVRSTNQYARKVLSDFLAGRLSYKNPKDRTVDLDQY